MSAGFKRSFAQKRENTAMRRVASDLLLQCIGNVVSVWLWRPRFHVWILEGLLFIVSRKFETESWPNFTTTQIYMQVPNYTKFQMYPH